MRISSLPTLAPVLLLLLAPLYAGCTLLGLGAAAGATVAGCAILDNNDDDRVTEAELSVGLFNAWDTNDNDMLTEAEFDAGVARSDSYEAWDDDFDEWDDDDNGMLTQAEFSGGAQDTGGLLDLVDNGCDDLGL
jgi:hypothetical protein